MRRERVNGFTIGAIGIDEHGYAIVRGPDGQTPAPVWIAPDGERVRVTCRNFTKRAAAYERVAREIVKRDCYRAGWRMSSGSATAFLRHQAWHTAHDTADETALYEAHMRLWRITHE